MDYKTKADKVNKVATTAQKKVINDMQVGDERLFLMRIQEPITTTSIDYVLRILVNEVEGDVSQLPNEHEKYARRKGWLKGWE
jgi:hypothetical protein